MLVFDTITTTTYTSGGDLYGGTWKTTTPQVITNKYSWKETWTSGGCYGYDINGIDAMTGGILTGVKSVSSGTDVFGNPTSTTTITDYYIVRGKMVTSKAVSTTSSTDILGNSTESVTTTEYTYKLINNKGEAGTAWKMGDAIKP